MNELDDLDYARRVIGRHHLPFEARHIGLPIWYATGYFILWRVLPRLQGDAKTVARDLMAKLYESAGGTESFFLCSVEAMERASDCLEDFNQGERSCLD